MTRKIKDPDDVIFFWIDFTDDLLLTSSPIEAISSIVTVITDLTVNSSAIDGNKVKMLLSGGNAGTTYPVTARILTSASQTMDKTLRIICLTR
jgi:hypothetical protein